MTNPYRAICAELVELSAPVDSIPRLAEHLQKLYALADRARALLAQPEPEGPTDEELLDLADWEVWDHQLLAFARAAIARHGRPTPQPVAVSERLDWRRPNALPTPEATNDPRPPASSLPN